jgi:ubiquinone/menaquinone biosynthesis C-methylase UbiE
VLKPGGKFQVLEFSTPQSEIVKAVYDFHSFNVIPNIGQFVSNDRESYQYLGK